MKDSVMLNCIFLAMNKAHEKLKTRQGLIGRLIEISKFYELAVMQLDGCLKIVEGKTEKFSLEMNHDEMLFDLYIVRDRLQRRLDATERTIINTDSCLADRFKNEVNLLQGDLDQLERPKRKGHRKTQKNQSNQTSRVTNGEKTDKNRLKKSSNQIFEERNFGAESNQIDRLGSDIDKLKKSMDVAFEKIQNAIFLSKDDANEYKWRWSIEKDVMLIAAKGLSEDFQEIHEPTVRKLSYFSPLMSEFRSLRNELEQLTLEKETEVQPSLSETDSRVKISSGTKEKPPLDSKKCKNDESPEQSGNYVAKLISTHERIIRKKVEEQRAKEKLIRERWYSAMRKDKKQSDGLNKKLQDVIGRLDGIITMSPVPESIPIAIHEDNIKPTHLRRFSSESVLDFRSISTSLFCQVDEDLVGQVKMLEIQKEDSTFQSLILEQVLAVLLKDWIKQRYDEYNKQIEQLLIKAKILNQDIENSKSKSAKVEDMCRKFGKENGQLYMKIKMLEQENYDFEGKSAVLEEIYVALLTTLTKELHEELQKMSASKDLLEEIVHEFTKML